MALPFSAKVFREVEKLPESGTNSCYMQAQIDLTN